MCHSSTLGASARSDHSLYKRNERDHLPRTLGMHVVFNTKSVADSSTTAQTLHIPSKARVAWSLIVGHWVWSRCWIARPCSCSVPVRSRHRTWLRRGHSHLHAAMLYSYACVSTLFGIRETDGNTGAGDVQGWDCC